MSTFRLANEFVLTCHFIAFCAYYFLSGLGFFGNHIRGANICGLGIFERLRLLALKTGDTGIQGLNVLLPIEKCHFGFFGECRLSLELRLLSNATLSSAAVSETLNSDSDAFAFASSSRPRAS